MDGIMSSLQLSRRRWPGDWSSYARNSSSTSESHRGAANRSPTEVAMKNRLEEGILSTDVRALCGRLARSAWTIRPGSKTPQQRQGCMLAYLRKLDTRRITRKTELPNQSYQDDASCDLSVRTLDIPHGCPVAPPSKLQHASDALALRASVCLPSSFLRQSHKPRPCTPIFRVAPLFDQKREARPGSGEPRKSHPRARHTTDNLGP